MLYIDIIKEKLAKILGENPLLQDYPKDAPLSEIGLDSLGFVSLVVALEEALSIEVPDSELLMDNFSTLEKIDERLCRYMQKTDIVLKKCLVLDCDGVLWDGIACEGEIIPNNSFQEQLVNLYKSGILLCLCSKNDSFAIDEVFEKYNEMPLKKEHILLEKVNWSDKADNIKAIAKELNIGLDSIVFIDDSDYEIGAVKGLLPEVTAIKFEEKMSLKGLFGADFTTIESQNRTDLYIQQRSREKAKRSFDSTQEYNASLQTKTQIKVMESADIPRVSELSMRTNKFSLSMKRYDAKTLENMLLSQEYSVFTMSASDIYGDMGIVGAAVLHIGDVAIIEAFMLSCRVIGRGFELELLDKVKEAAADFGCVSLSGVYLQTEVNSHFASFYSENGVAIYG